MVKFDAIHEIIFRKIGIEIVWLNCLIELLKNIRTNFTANVTLQREKKMSAFLLDQEQGKDVNASHPYCSKMRKRECAGKKEERKLSHL